MAVLLAVGSWAGFALSARAITYSHFSVVDVQAIRYVLPTMLLTPWWPRAWSQVRSASPITCTAIAVGGGLPFFLLTALGARLSTASHVTLINLGAAPVLVALIVALRGGPRPRLLHGVGLLLTTAGVCVVIAGTSGGRIGVLVLLGAASLWALLTVAQERAGLGPLSLALLVSAPSALPSAALLGIEHPDHFVRMSANEFAMFVVTQGVFSGIISSISLATAIRHLGARRTVLYGAVTPIVVAIASAACLGEPLSPLASAGLGLIVLGTVAGVGARSE